MIDGGFVNSFGGAVSGLILMLVIAGVRPDFSAYLTVPAYYYTAGVFGLVCLLLCTPDGGTACFFLNNDGTRGDISAEESPEEEVKPILVWNPEADMAQERFTYLDELFTTY